MQDEGQAKGASGSAPLDYGEEATLTLKTKPDQKKKKKRETPTQGWAGLRVPRGAAPAAVSVLGALPRPLPRDRGALRAHLTTSLRPLLLPPFSLVGLRAANRGSGRRSQARPLRISTELQARRGISGGDGGSSGSSDSSNSRDCSRQRASLLRRA